MRSKKRRSKACLALILTAMSIFCSLVSVEIAYCREADIDWSQEMPEEYIDQSDERHNIEFEDSTYHDESFIDEPFPNSNPLTTPTNKNSITIEQDAPEIGSFDAEWNSTHDLDPKSYGINKSNTRIHELKGRMFEPIWRPIYSQVTLDDFDFIDCCVRVIQSSALEVEEKCERSGQKVWQSGNVAFTPKEPYIERNGSCYMLDKKAVGNAWKYQCTTKSMAKCYDPRLPQNYEFIEMFNADEAVKSALESELGAEGEKGQTLVPMPSLETLLKLIPSRPRPEPPADLSFPIISD